MLAARFFLPSVLLAVLAGPAWADRVTLTNGSTFEGEIISQTDAEVIIRTAHGVITLQASRVKSIVKAPWTPPPTSKVTASPSKAPTPKASSKPAAKPKAPRPAAPKAKKPG